MTKDDIERVIGDYVSAAGNAIRAGFDGVQVHGANGYLIDQFLRDGANQRNDDYGGPIANRLRFMREVVAAVGSEVGIARTSIRLSPIGEVQGANDSDNAALFTAAAGALEALGVPWIELREPGPQSTFIAVDEPAVSPAMRRVFSGKIVLNSDYDGTNGPARMAEGVADAISFGRPYIANPDLVERLRDGATLTEADPATFYSNGPEGYTDYPVRTEQEAA